jgi:hypothetical protein
VALNRDGLPVRARSGGELAERVRRAEDYAVLGARVLVDLHTESHAINKPSTRVWAITRRADRARRLADQRTKRPDRCHTDRASRADRTSRPHRPQGGRWWPIPANPTDGTSVAAKLGSALTGAPI